MASAARIPVLHPASLRERFTDARANTDSLFSYIERGALYERPIAERHRLIFYLGHLETFEWNLIARGAAKVPAFDERLDKLFAFGIDPVDGGLPSDQPSDWPRESEILNYNSRVRDQLDAVIADPTAAALRDPYFADGTLLQVAIEHRLMHAETLAYLVHQLPYDQKSRAPMRLDVSSDSPEPRIVKIPSGIATLGKARGTSFGTSFGWDNEFGEQQEEVNEFRADVYPVTNAQYLEFLRAGGYDDASLWNDADWKWRQESNLEHPHYWRKRGDQWFWHAMFAEIPLPLAWPVYVSHAEASAYSRWSGKKLPTETQWHRMAYGAADGTENEYPWGEAQPARAFGNFDFKSWDPTPVDSHPAGRSAFGVEDLVGNGWEWTSTKFAPLANFEPFPFYAGYSANFFDGHHYVMKGGSPRTASCMLRRSFRNWFQPHYPYMYAKFRCVED